MKRKSITYSLLAALLFSATCCIGEHDGFWGSNPNELKVTAYYASAAAYQTRSTADSTRTDSVANDTLYINDQTCMTTQVTDLIADLPFGTAPADTTGGTRGTPIDTPDQLTSMNVVMFNTATTDYAEATATDLYTVTATKGDFVLDKSYSWTAGSLDKHTFLAFAPKTGTAGITLAADKKSVTYTMPATVADQPDLCISDIANNRNIVNTVGSNNHNQRFSMRHCLTAIGFEAVGYDVRITKVTLKGASTTAVLNLTTGAWSSFANAADRLPGIDTGRWLMCENKDQMVNLTNANGYLMMIPQDLTNISLVMEYEGRNQQVGTGSYTVKLRDVGVQWTAGKKIIYQLRLKTKPAVDNNSVILADPRGGYTTELPLNIAAATDDNLTFSWNEPWLRIYRGNPGYVNPSAGGAPSGWSTGVNNWNNLYFFSNADNPSTATTRTATVTVTGKKSGKRTFTVTQNKMMILNISPTGPGQTIPLEGRTYSIDIKSSTTWLGTEQTGATLWPASGDGNGGAYVDIPQNRSWKENQVKIVISTTNTSGPVFSRTWTGTQPGVGFYWVVGPGNNENPRAGFMAPGFELIAADDDEITFTWNESWVRAYCGKYVKYIDPASASGSGLKVKGSQVDNVFFLSSNDNRSPRARYADITMRSKNGTTYTVAIGQDPFNFKLTDDSEVLMDSSPGYTSVISGIEAAPDDELTLTSASGTMKFCLMNTPQNGIYVNPATALSNGCKIRGSDLSKLCAVSNGNKGDNAITITSAAGGKINKRIAYAKPWKLFLNFPDIIFGAVTNAQTYVGTQNRGLLFIEYDLRVPQDKGTLSVKSRFEGSTVSSNGWLDKDWGATTFTDGRSTGNQVFLYFTTTMKRNIHPVARRAKVVIEVTYKGETQTQTLPVAQDAADYYYIFDGFDAEGKPNKNQPQLAVQLNDLGQYDFGQGYRCASTYGSNWNLPNCNNLSWMRDMKQRGYFVQNPFDPTKNYWTTDWDFDQPAPPNWVNYFSGSDLGKQAIRITAGATFNYRCVRNLDY